MWKTVPLVCAMIACDIDPANPKPPNKDADEDTDTDTTDDTTDDTTESGTDTGDVPIVDNGVWGDDNPFPWEWENPTPNGYTVFEIDGLGTDDVWTFGRSGWIEHFDGNGWTPMYLPDLGGDYPYQDIYSAAVLAEGVVTFPSSAGSTIISPDEVLTDDPSWGSVMWGSAPDDVWSIANNFQVGFHYDGVGWVQDPSFPGFTYDRGSGYTDMDGVSADWIIAVGWYGVIASYDGAWSVSTPFEEDLEGVYATGPDTSNWIVGEDGLLVEWNASGVVSSSYITDKGLHDIWGADDQLWAVGDDGTVLHYDGSTWNSQNTGATVSLYSVWGSSTSDVWVGGFGGELIHWDGATWTRRSNHTRTNWEHIGPTPDGEVVAAGFLSLGFRDNGAWTEIEVPFDPPFWNGFEFESPILSVGATTEGTYVGGKDGQIAMWDGSGWTALPAARFHDIHDLVANSEDLLFAAYAGGVYVWNGASWADGVEGDFFDARFLNLWATPDQPDVWATGEYGVWHYNGTSWSELDGIGNANCVWASGPDDVWVGTEWGLYAWDGVDWEQVSATDGMRIYSIWGDGVGNIWFGGWGDVYHWDGAVLTATFYGETPEVTGIAGQAVWVAGSGGAILRHDL